MQLTHSMRLLREPNFRRFFIGQTTSTLGTSMAMLALTFGVLGTGASVSSLGVVLAASAVSQIVITLLGGVISDRWERRRVLIGTDVMLGLTQLCMGALFLTHHASVWLLVALRLVYGASAAFFAPAITGAIVDVVGAETMQEAHSFLGLGRSSARLLGPAIGGIIIAVSNPGWALIIDAATFGVSAYALMRIHASFSPASAVNSVWQDFLHGWHEFTSRKWAVQMIFGFMLYQATALPALFVLGPVHARDAWNGAASWAAVMTCAALGDVLGGLLTLHWRPSRLLIASTAVWALDIPFILFLGLQVASPVPVMAAGVGFGVAMTAGSTLWYQALATGVPSASLSRVTSYDEVGSLVFNPLGYAVVGVVAAGIGARATFAIVLGTHLVMLALLLTSRSVNAMRRIDTKEVVA